MDILVIGMKIDQTYNKKKIIFDIITLKPSKIIKKIIKNKNNN
jgi:hypothetical protein